MRAFRCVVVGSVLVLFLGLHWTALQTFAWTRMLFDYSRSVPLRAAVAMTFGGHHPCALCQAIKEGRDSEQKQPMSVSSQGVKLECDIPEESELITARSVSPPPAVITATWFSRSEDPPKPRPRLLSAA